MASRRIPSAPFDSAAGTSRSVPAPDVVVEPVTARPPAQQGDAHGRVEGEAGAPASPSRKVTAMWRRARDLIQNAPSHRWSRKFPPGGRRRILPNRVHLRRGYRLRGHIPR